MNLQDLNLAIVDIETTGSSALHDRVIEVGVIRVEKGVVVATFDQLVDPQVPIPPIITSITGITDRDVRGAPTFGQIASQLWGLLEGCIFTAHNARFDYGFLRQEFRRWGKDLSADCLCSVRLSRALFKEEAKHNLSALIERFHIPCEHRHRALGDASVVWEFLKLLPGRKDVGDITKALAVILKRPTLPPQLDAALLDKLPESPGVYIFYGDQGMPIYIGKSVDVRQRVLAHFSGEVVSVKQQRMFSQIQDIAVRPTAGDLGAMLLESHLIKTLRPLHNYYSRRASQLTALRRMTDDAGYHCLAVEKVSSLGPGSFADVAAIFRSQKEAREYLQEASRDYQLCRPLLGLEKRKKKGCLSSQLGRCRGACENREPAEEYNDRLRRSLRRVQLTPWPFSGPVLVDDSIAEGQAGQVFVVNEWCLLKAVTYDEHGQKEFFPADGIFNPDVYKILHSFMQRHPDRVKHIKNHQEIEIQHN